MKLVKPTGRTAWPRILLEGTEHSGKSWSVAELSASPKVGQTVVLPLGEDWSMWHEYGNIPGSRFMLAGHDGLWSSIIRAAKDARAMAEAAVAAGEPPFVFAIDTMTAVRDGLWAWMDRRAASNAANRKALEADPDAKIERAPNYWNDANSRHDELMGVLLTIPGIVIMVARGGEVTLFENGQPSKSKEKTWSVQVQKSVPFAATAHLRVSNEARPLLVSRKGVFNGSRPGVTATVPLADDWTLESVIFGTLGLDSSTTAVGGYTEMRQDLPPAQILAEAVRPETTFARIKELRELVYDLHYDGVALPNGEGHDELLLSQLVRVGHEKKRAEDQAAAAAKPASPTRAEVLRSLAANDQWIDPISELADLAAEAALRANFLETFSNKPADDPRVVALTALLDLKRAELQPKAAA